METLTLTGGKYAVFIHKGTPAEFPLTAAYIYRSWLPDSGYELEEREHFEVMGPKYLPNDPNAEEEIWFPVKG